MNKTLGLTNKEALERLSQFGKNEITTFKKINPLSIFISQFKSFLILILIIAALLSLASSIVAKSDDFLDTIFIFIILFVNAILGFVQEFKAEKAIAALKKMIVEKIRVIRDGEELEIDATLLVPGDVIIIEEGKRIPADAQLLSGFNIQTNEAPLTGESAPVPKEAAGSGKEDKNFVYAGTIAESGFGKAKVSATGLNTRFGKIAKLLEMIKEEPTPLQENLTKLGRQLGVTGIIAATVVIGAGVFYGTKILEMLLTGTSLAVAVIPEGLPAVVTITLAIGVQRMARVHSIIRKLSSIEAIGSVDVICSDKTGTITKNEMVVKRVFLNQKIFELSDEKLTPGVVELKKILKISALCSTASLAKDNGKLTVLGDRTEGALLAYAAENNFDFAKIRSQEKIVTEFPFDPRIKMMSVVTKTSTTKSEILTKGAPEIVLEKSTKISIEGKILPISAEVRGEIEAAITAESSKGYRLLAFANRETENENIPPREAIEANLTFVGFVSIFDPPREEVKSAISVVQNAGVKVVMITGDNPLTAATIAFEIGLVKNSKPPVLTGADLDKMTNDKLKEKVKECLVFARVTPEHKLRIVQAFQNLGFSVAVTGDGVNDAPALKAADVGMAMGIIGTDVAKEASDMVIADDNFTSIVAAVRQGRVVYENILKSTRYLLSCNSGELMAILGAVIVGFPSPLTPVQILWMNLVTDGLPALALSQDRPNPAIMERSPRSKSDSIVKSVGISWILVFGIILALATILPFAFLNTTSTLDLARTTAFTILVLGEMVVAFLARRGETWYSNKLLLLAVVTTIILQIVILTFAPFQKIFDTKLPF